MSDQTLLELYTKIHDNMTTGFRLLHKKIDTFDKECDKRWRLHDERVVEIEQELAIRKALNGQRREGHRFWRVVLNTIIVAGVLALCTIAGKLIIFGIGL